MIDIDKLASEFCSEPYELHAKKIVSMIPDIVAELRAARAGGTTMPWRVGTYDQVFDSLEIARREKVISAATSFIKVLESGGPLYSFKDSSSEREAIEKFNDLKVALRELNEKGDGI